MTRESAQTSIPRIQGYPVDAIAESAAQYGLADTAEKYHLSQSSVERACGLWSKIKQQKGML